MKKADLEPGQRGALTRLENKLFAEFSDKKEPIPGFFEYIIINLFALACLAYPLFVSYVLGVQTAANEKPMSVWINVIGLGILEGGVIYGGVKLAQFVMNAAKREKPTKDDFLVLMEYWTGNVIGFVLRGVAKLIVKILSIGLIVGACVMAVNTQIMYGGWYYAEINSKSNGETREKKIEGLNETLSRLQARYDIAFASKCLSAQAPCAKKKVPADTIAQQIKAVNEEKFALLDQVASSKGGGIDLLQNTINSYLPATSDKTVITARYTLLGIVCVLGSLLCILLLSTSYYYPVAKWMTDRRAWKQRYSTEEFGASEVPVPKTSLSRAVKGFIGQRKNEIVQHVNDKTRARISTEETRAAARINTEETRADARINETARINSARLVHTNCTKETTARINLDKAPLQDLPSDDSVHLHEESARLVHTNCTNETARIKLHELDETARITPTIEKGKEKTARKRGPREDSESDTVIIEYVQAQHPDFDSLAATGLMRAIKKVGGELNKSKGKGARIGDGKAKRIYARMTGKAYQLDGRV